MFKKLLLLLALVPVLNFLHESGHWLGGKAIGANPQMLLQRVDMGDESQYSSTQISAFNWSGPATNYALIAASFVQPSLALTGFMMACHRLGPNAFASLIYIKGNRSFTTDETKPFSTENRLLVAVLFSVLYLSIALALGRILLPGLKLSLVCGAIAVVSGLWFGYLIFLDYLDRL